MKGALDWGRLLAAMLVVAIHTSPLGSFSAEADFVLTRILARLAVPFFLMCSGYFLLGEAGAAGRFGRFAHKTLLLYAGASLLYLPLNLYAGHLQGLGPADWLRLLLFDGTFYHLWYLPAVLLGAGLLLACRRLAWQWQLGLAAALYLLGLLGDSYFGLLRAVPPLQAAYQAMFQLFSYTRNGLFYTPLFLLLGALLRKPPARLERRAFWQNLAGLAVALLCLLAEGLALHNLGWQRHDSMYLALPAAMWFLFRLALSLPWRSAPAVRPLAAWVYILHPAVLVAWRGLAKALGWQAWLLDNSLLRYAAVCVLSFAAACVCRKAVDIYCCCLTK